MPFKCCVPECGSNLKSGENEKYISMFSFPDDDATRLKWLNAIPRKDLTITKNTRVCIEHFPAHEIQTYDVYLENGVEKKWKRVRPTLKKDAVPSIFPGCPSYLSKNIPAPRTDPDLRRITMKKNEELLSQKKLDKNVIHGFNDLKMNFHVKLKVIEELKYLQYVSDSFILFYKLDFKNNPKVSFSLQIFDDLTVKLFKNEYIIEFEDIDLKFKANSKIEKWSDLSDILEKLNGKMNNNEMEAKKKLEIIEKNICNSCKVLIDCLNAEETYEHKEKLLFLCEQFLLIRCNQKRYSINLTITCFIIYSQSLAAYEALREAGILTLPHPGHLQRLSTSFNIDPKNESSNKHFLSFLTKALTSLEKIVVLSLDEIYVKQNITYKCGELLGQAQNNLKEVAKTMQSFMVHSAFGSFQEVVALVPIKNLTGSYLASLTHKALKIVHESGLQVLVISCDDNKVNQSLYAELSAGSPLPYQMENPFIPGAPIFLMFDPVHLFKNIRNNWINQKDPQKTLVFPDFNDPYRMGENIGCIVKLACFSDLRNLYSNESNDLAKQAFKLNYKALYPTKLERQNVKLVDSLFHDTTIAALKTSGSKENYTSEFMEIIQNWWQIVNIKSTLKGKIKRKEICLPFKKADDERFDFLEKFLNWLNVWQNLNLDTGHLTKDTHQALFQTTYVMIEVIKYSINVLKVPYVLPGKFQSDNLEKRFGRYRQLSGCSYNVTVTQVYEAEKKLRIKSVLGIHSSRYGQVKFNPEILKKGYHYNDSEETSLEKKENTFFDEVMEENYLAHEIDVDALIYIAGHTSYKVIKNIDCSECKTLLGEKGGSSDSEYYNLLQRGGLTVPKDLVLKVCIHAMCIMQCLVSEKFEEKFLQEKKQKAVLTGLIFRSLGTDSALKELLTESCFLCQNLYKLYIAQIVSICCNILLNNYSKLRNDTIARSKGNYGENIRTKTTRKLENYAKENLKSHETIPCKREKK